MDSGVAATGESLGLEFNYDRIRLTPNTLADHRLLWWARAQDRQDALATALFFAYFTEGKDIGQAEVLAETAAVVGLDPLKAVTFLESEEGLQEVAQEEAAARRSGLNGVPFLSSTTHPRFQARRSLRLSWRLSATRWVETTGNAERKAARLKGIRRPAEASGSRELAPS